MAAARGMLTTDTIHKLAGRTISIAGRDIQITGMAKGAAMMGPNMATMLARGDDRRRANRPTWPKPRSAPRPTRASTA